MEAARGKKLFRRLSRPGTHWAKNNKSASRVTRALLARRMPELGLEELGQGFLRLQRQELDCHALHEMTHDAATHVAQTHR